MEAVSVINLLPSNKIEVEDFFLKVKNNVLESGSNPFQFAVQVKAFEVLIDRLRKDNDIQDWIIEEALKEGKSFEFLGNKIEVREAGVKYDYSSCEDAEWEELDAQIKELSEKKKQRESFLKVIPLDGTVNPSSGELIYPPSKKSYTSLFITLK